MQTVNIRESGGKWLARPGKVYVARGEDVAFIADGTEARIFIPKSNLFDAPAAGGTVSGDAIILTVLRGGQAAIRAKQGSGVKVPIDKDKWIKCPYAIFCHAGEDFAEGNSSPVMLVEPPS